MFPSLHPLLIIAMVTSPVFMSRWLLMFPMNSRTNFVLLAPMAAESTANTISRAALGVHSRKNKENHIWNLVHVRGKRNQAMFSGRLFSLYHLCLKSQTSARTISYWERFKLMRWFKIVIVRFVYQYREVIHLLELLDYLLVQADNPWYNYSCILHHQCITSVSESKIMPL